MAPEQNRPGSTPKPPADPSPAASPDESWLARSSSELEIVPDGAIAPAPGRSSARQIRRAEAQLERIDREAHQIEAAQLRDDAATDRDDNANARSERAERTAATQQANDPANGPLQEALAANTVLREQARRDRDRAADDRARAAVDRDHSTADRRQARIELSDTERQLETLTDAAREVEREQTPAPADLREQ